MGQLEAIKPLAQPYLESGEELLAAMTANPRGTTTARAGGGMIASEIGRKMTSKVVQKGAASDLRIESNMVVGVTDHRLVTLKVKISMGGSVTAVTELLSALPLSEIQSIEAKRFGLGGVLVITAAGGAPVKLECRVGRAKDLVEAFTQAKAAAA